MKQPDLFATAPQRFVALDFETANPDPTSACSLAVVTVENEEIVDCLSILIRPPSPRFDFSWLHGITWKDVAGQPTFRDHWSDIESRLAAAEFLVAHNAPFDRGVMRACCTANHVQMPDRPFFCTVQLSRRTWALRSNKLNLVCEHLGIALHHHQAESDAQACARIVLAARRHWAPKDLPWNPLR
jgi:DNA polymerase III subunit epsilon